MHARSLLPNPLDWLLGLYAENYARLNQLLPTRTLPPGRYVKTIPERPDLVLDVFEQQPYTTLLRLSLRFVEAAPAEDPESYWRVYHDGRQAEVTHCRFDSHRRRLFAPETPAKIIAQYRRHMNNFASKWLEHLIGQGYDGGAWILEGPVPAWNPEYIIAPGSEDDLEEPTRRRATKRPRSVRV